MSEKRFAAHQEPDGRVWIDDDDFGWDATLHLGGDFYGPDKLEFANSICEALNAAKLPTRAEWEQKNTELAQKLMHPYE